MVLKALKKTIIVTLKWSAAPVLITIAVMSSIKSFFPVGGKDIIVIIALITPFFVFMMVFRGLILEYDKV